MFLRLISSSLSGSGCLMSSVSRGTSSISGLLSIVSSRLCSRCIRTNFFDTANGLLDAITELIHGRLGSIGLLNGVRKIFHSRVISVLTGFNPIGLSICLTLELRGPTTHNIASRALNPQVSDIIRRLRGGNKYSLLSVCGSLSLCRIGQGLRDFRILNPSPRIDPILIHVAIAESGLIIVVKVAKVSLTIFIGSPIDLRLCQCVRDTIIEPSLNSAIDLIFKISDVAIKFANCICQVRRV